MSDIDYSKTQATVGYLVKDNKVLLIEKGRNLGQGKLTGVGGRQEEGETLEQTIRREIGEEIMVQVEEVRKVAEIIFVFPHNPKYSQRVTAYIIDSWEGEPQVTDEAKSVNWFDIDKLPTEKMWPDNAIWLPRIFSNKLIKALFTIGPDDRVTDYTLEEVRNFKLT